MRVFDRVPLLARADGQLACAQVVNIMLSDATTLVGVVK